MSEADRLKQWAPALGRIPSGLFVVTARHDGLETGMLASWVQQCSFEPPQLTLSIKRGREIGAWLAEGEPFVVNILDDSQTDMISHFGRGFAPDEPAFDGLAVERAPCGAVVLAEALAFLECRVQSFLPVGDHDLFVARVAGGGLLNEGQSMVHVRKSGLHY
jgi:flavin reductase (DIM6/NTAB) family NADH-FMN oxidoreductase RutF